MTMPTDTSMPPIARSNVIPRPTRSSSTLLRKMVAALPGVPKYGDATEKTMIANAQAASKDHSRPFKENMLSLNCRIGRFPRELKVELVDILSGKYSGRSEKQNALLCVVGNCLVETRNLVFRFKLLAVDELFASPDGQVTKLSRIP